MYAEIAQLVEHNLAKVGVASSSLVFRSLVKTAISCLFFVYVPIVGRRHRVRSFDRGREFFASKASIGRLRACFPLFC